MVNQRIVIAVVVIGGVWAVNAFINKKPVTPVLIGSIVLVVALSIADLYQPLGKIAGSIAMLAALVTVLVHGGPIFDALQKLIASYAGGGKGTTGQRQATDIRSNYGPVPAPYVPGQRVVTDIRSGRGQPPAPKPAPAPKKDTCAGYGEDDPRRYSCQDWNCAALFNPFDPRFYACAAGQAIRTGKAIGL